MQLSGRPLPLTNAWGHARVTLVTDASCHATSLADLAGKGNSVVYMRRSFRGSRPAPEALWLVYRSILLLLLVRESGPRRGVACVEHKCPLNSIVSAPRFTHRPACLSLSVLLRGIPHIDTTYRLHIIHTIALHHEGGTHGIRVLLRHQPSLPY